MLALTPTEPRVARLLTRGHRASARHEPRHAQARQGIRRQEIAFAIARVPDGRARSLRRLRLQGLRRRPRRRRSSSRRSSYGHESYVTGVALAGKTLVSGGYDGKLIWWDIDDRRSDPHASTAHAKWIRKVVASPDGKLVASVADDMVCRLWDAADRQARPRAARAQGEDAARLPLDALRLRLLARRQATSPPATRSGTSSSGRSTTGQQVGDARSAGHVHLGPGAAAALDRRHPLAGVLARTASSWPSAASGKIGNIDHLEGKARVEVFDWKAGKQTAEFPGDKFSGLVNRLAFAAGRLVARSAPAAPARASCSSSTWPPRRRCGRRRCRCTSTTST